LRKIRLPGSDESQRHDQRLAQHALQQRHRRQGHVEEAERFFVKEKNKTEHMNFTKFYTDDKFGLVIDMRSTADQSMHGSGTRIVNSTDGVQLEIERKAEGSGNVNCNVFVVSDSQINIMNSQLESVQY